MSDDELVSTSSGNVFEDAGRPDADLRLAKAELARAIRCILAARGMNQSQAAVVLGIAQPDVSDLTRGRLGRFSMDRLERFLNALDMDVRIQVAPKRPASNRAALTVDATYTQTFSFDANTVIWTGATSVTLPKMRDIKLGNIRLYEVVLQQGLNRVLNTSLSVKYGTITEDMLRIDLDRMLLHTKPAVTQSPPVDTPSTIPVESLPTKLARAA